MSRLSAGIRRGFFGLVPAGRREWVEALWAETHEVPPGLRRLAWRAGGVRLIAKEALIRRGIGAATLFLLAVVAVARAAWPSSSTSAAVPIERVGVITLAVLAALPVLSRPFLGAVGVGRTAKLMRFGTCAALLALIPAETVVDQFKFTPPAGGIDLRLYGLVSQTPPGHGSGKHILLLIVLALYAIAIIWITARRSQVAPATLAAGASGGLALGLVMYAVAPLGLSAAATNPLLPGTDVDPLVLLAWLLLFCGPLAAGVVAHRRYTASSSSASSARDAIRQIMAAGLLTSLTGALFVNVLGTGTIAVMLKAAWLRNWLYHGHHLFYGVQHLSSDLKTSTAIAYAHGITGAADSAGLGLVLVVFPVIALLLSAWLAAGLCGGRSSAEGSPPPGGGGLRGPEPTSGGGLPRDTADDVGPVPNLPDLEGLGVRIDDDRRVPLLADAAVAAPAGAP